MLREPAVRYLVVRGVKTEVFAKALMTHLQMTTATYTASTILLKNCEIVNYIDNLKKCLKNEDSQKLSRKLQIMDKFRAF